MFYGQIVQQFSSTYKCTNPAFYTQSTEWHYLSKVVSSRHHVTYPKVKLRLIQSSAHSSNNSQILEWPENNILRGSNTIVMYKILQNAEKDKYTKYDLIIHTCITARQLVLQSCVQ